MGTAPGAVTEQGDGGVPTLCRLFVELEACMGTGGLYDDDSAAAEAVGWRGPSGDVCAAGANACITGGVAGAACGMGSGGWWGG